MSQLSTAILQKHGRDSGIFILADEKIKKNNFNKKILNANN